MKLQYLGTAAAEGIPALFCRCDCCIQAAAQPKNQRCRSSVLVNGHLLIDLTPDIYLQKLRYGLDLAAVDTLLITHSHSDHLDAQELTRRSTANYCHITGESPLTVYGSEKVCSIVHQALFVEFGDSNDLSILPKVIEPGRSLTVGELTVTALEACHDPAEQCMVYLVADGTRQSYLHCNDSGILSPSAISMLTRVLAGGHLSVISMDCTFGARNVNFPGHMGLEQNLRLRELLQQWDCVDENTRYLATHFSHNCGMNHRQLSETFAPHGIEVAWDGLEIDLKTTDN